MSFNKYGDGKIISVIDDEELSEEQKKALKNLSEKVVKTSENPSKSKTDMAGR